MTKPDAHPTLVSIFPRPASGEDAALVAEAFLSGETGLEGDYEASQKDATWRRQVTLIETAALRHVAESIGVNLRHQDTRRNLLVDGADLNSLVDQQFQIGDAILLGTSLCHPCETLESRTAPGVLAALAMRGGLCAKVIKSGRIWAGAELRVTGK